MTYRRKRTNMGITDYGSRFSTNQYGTHAGTSDGTTVVSDVA
jgi:hypothetical protein